MAKVTEKEKALFVELYDKLGSYAAVARETGWSASTVRRWVMAYKEEESAPDKNDTSIPYISFTEQDYFNTKSDENLVRVQELFANTEDWGTLCELTESEKDEMSALRKERLK